MEEKNLKIVAVQMSSFIGDKQANFDNVERLISRADTKDADVIVLPEVWTIGWKPSIFAENAEDINSSETISFLSRLAKKYNSYIIGGSFISKKDNKLYNTCPVLNRDGELIASYDKMHLFSYYGCDEGTFIERGENPVLVVIEGVKIGLSICYDIRFPEIYRAYRQAGADMQINMAAWPKSRPVHWEALTKARAIENQCFMLAITQSGLIEGEEWNLGHSRMIDYNGETLAEINNGEGTIVTEINFNEMYQFRKKCTVLLDIQQTYEVI